MGGEKQVIKPNNDPMKKVFKQVVLFACPITVILLVMAYMLDWEMLEITGGFWLGVVVNLVSFKMIIKSADQMINAKENHGMSAAKSSGFLGRFLFYALCFFLIVQYGTRTMIIGFGVGISMVALVLKLGAFIKK